MITDGSVGMVRERRDGPVIVESDGTHPSIIADGKKLSIGNGQTCKWLKAVGFTCVGLGTANRTTYSRHDHVWSGSYSSKKVAYLDIVAYKSRD